MGAFEDALPDGLKSKIYFIKKMKVRVNFLVHLVM